MITRPCLLIVLLSIFSSLLGLSQTPVDTTNISTDSSATNSPLFETEEILELVIRGDIKSLLRDRAEESEYHELELITQDSQSKALVHPLKIRTRGNFRKKRANCFYPPLRLNFPKKAIPSGSVFAGQDKLKLVMPCKGDKYVIREYLTYKLNTIVSKYSFKARLVRVSFEDTRSNKKDDPFYAFILEDEDEMAKRYQREIKEINRVQPKETDLHSFLNMAVFQFLIGNTDWSIQFRQNIKLLYAKDIKEPIPVPYDFDHAGIVNAPYALPPIELELSSTRERRYRGFCIEKEQAEFDQTLNFYQEIKDDVYKVYTDCSLIDDKYKKRTLRFLDKFYKILDSPAKRKAAFNYPCLPNGTGNIIIKGLNN